ncbi:MAG: hypothetical protein K8U57_19090 [Planctomycetes bacterium]|nr:hypothetical protein [Planctomycetota bacterium]
MPAASEIPKLPAPVILLIVTVAPVPDPPLTLTVPLAVPVLFSVISAAVSVFLLKLVSA